jgi:hypothetical protein
MSGFTESVVEQAALAWFEVALGGAADEPGPIAVGHHVRVLVREGEPTAKVVVGAVGDHEEPDLAIAEREPRDVVRKIDEPGSNALRLEQLAHVGDRRMPEAETSTLLFSKPLTMLSRVPAGLRSRERVRGNGRKVAIDAHEALEVRQLTPESHALSQLLEDGRLPDDRGLRAEQGGERVLVLEGVRHELAHVEAEEERDLVELETRHRTIARLDLHERRTRDAQVLAE